MVGSNFIHVCAFSRDVLIFDALQHDIMEVTNLGSSNPLLLCAMDDDHYDVIYHKEHILTAGFCQCKYINLI